MLAAEAWGHGGPRGFLDFLGGSAEICAGPWGPRTGRRRNFCGPGPSTRSLCRHRRMRRDSPYCHFSISESGWCHKGDSPKGEQDRAYPLETSTCPLDTSAVPRVALWDGTELKRCL